MTPSEIAGWVGATTGVVSLGWNIYLKVSSGPKLAIAAYSGMIVMPPPPGNPRLLSVTVQNVGTVPTTVTNLSIHTYKSKRQAKTQMGEFNAVAATFYNQKYPFPLKTAIGMNGADKYNRTTNLMH